MVDAWAPSGGIEVEGRGPGEVLLRLRGDWTTRGIAALERPPLGAATGHARLTVDAAGLSALDTGGALLLHRLLGGLAQAGVEAELTGLAPTHARLLELVRARTDDGGPGPAASGRSRIEELGRWAWGHLAEGWALLGFIGETAAALAGSAVRPTRIRWRAFLASLQSTGADAVPIVSLLAFLIGVVVAYQGGVQLRAYGANVYVVDLVILMVLRELGPMIAAVIVAGRSGSAFTAQIGAMKVNEEIDALRTIGIDPVDLLVVPRFVALVVSLPLLTALAGAMGVLGGMVMAAGLLGVGYHDFLQRVPQAGTLASFLVGMGKAPVFAAIIATVGCFQGFRVGVGADSVGRQTTVSVVQAIFFIIVADAAFSVLFAWLGV
ncbi:MAG: MlaE family lipid ABC transporter permease subunit [Gammaproteobacteria bacterium]|jgi:phospholipid/cholesterol/gamma-HCH transport system permease protein|nr:MlaE family lipid ABC transporter permease subunit [Gammaproteobacteria bacterium]